MLFLLTFVKLTSHILMPLVHTRIMVVTDMADIAVMDVVTAVITVMVTVMVTAMVMVMVIHRRKRNIPNKKTVRRKTRIKKP